MAVKINTAFLFGIEAHIISVEVNIENGFPCFNIVGLAGTSVRESRDRVRASIINSGFKFPIKKITVNLAPSDIKKFGSLFDLPIALGILYATGQINFIDSNDFIVVGELSLFGNLNSIKGVLPITIDGLKNNIKKFIVPYGNLEECSVVKGIYCYAFKNLNQVVNFIKNRNISACSYSIKRENQKSKLDFSDIHGQESCKRAAEIAAAGKHNMLMIGPPGCGKTMIAKRIPSILPKLSYKDALEVTKIYSAAGMLGKHKSLIVEPPFRNPHHTTTPIALIGGGSNLMPGEISLAHNGILFLDEILEFKRSVLEVLRQPIEENFITISRSSGKVRYPCNFMTVMATNPCKCGNFASNRPCTCSEYERKRYMSKLSNALIDRLDIFIFVNTPSFNDLNGNKKNDTSLNMKKRVIAARKIQEERFKEEIINYNSEMDARLIKKFCTLDDKNIKLLEKIFLKYNISARAYNKILKISRTIADIDLSPKIREEHIIEALNYRRFMNNKII
jgi:magnesium chelatase family protein